MEKKTREKKIPTGYETIQEDYWEIRNASGYPISYETEETAKKAEEFLKQLNWTRECIPGQTGGVDICLVKGYLMCPPEELAGEYDVPIVEDAWALKGMTGEFKTLEVTYYDYDVPNTEVVVLDEIIKEQLLNFINNGNESQN